ncbi:MAG: NAD(P)H-dependent oxidoreductase [Cyanobacteria bacterium P01_E01_bin.42]
MQIMNLVFHPDLKKSRVNRIWKQQLEESGKITTSRDMYLEYPDFQIDIDREQRQLLAHDRIILQFPFYWYSCPPLLKKWLDDVLTYGFAYGSTGDKLKGKELQIITSAGGEEKFYSGFDIYATIYELLRPFQLTANLCQMRYMLPVWMYRADSAPEDVIRKSGDRWVAMIDDPLRGDGRAFLESESDLS